MSVNERIKILIDTYERGVASSLAKKIDVAPTVVSSMLPTGRGSKPSFDVLAKILDAYPQISADWLIKGEEPMLLDQVRESRERMYHYDLQAQDLFVENGKLKEQIEAYEIDLKAYRNFYNSMRSHIEELNQEIIKLNDQIYDLQIKVKEAQSDKKSKPD